MRKARFFIGLAIALAAGCIEQPNPRGFTQGLTPSVPTDAGASALASLLQAAPDGKLLGNGKIQHVVIIVQENRTPDNLFNGLPGADTVRSGLNSASERVSLITAGLTAPFDVDHEHRAFVVAYNGGEMNGFNLERSNCSGTKCPQPYARAYAYVPRKDVEPYFKMAMEYAFADRMFQTNQGPSFSAHQYILSGTSTVKLDSPLRAAELPITPRQKFTGGCDSPAGSLVVLIDEKGAENRSAYPCFERPSFTDLVEGKHLTWRYYQAHPSAGLWNAPDAIRHVRYGSTYATDVVSPPSRILRDAPQGDLANVVWVTPTAKASDHAGNTNGTGPAWVASVVNAIGRSKYWPSTAIFVTWDDWGGWYDHVKPPIYNSYELGFRVPLIVISPYTRKGYVSHRQHEFGSILRFAEEAFGLGSLGSTDARSDNLADCFDFSHKPRSFTPIKSNLPPSYFLNEPPSDDDEEPDTDF